MALVAGLASLSVVLAGGCEADREPTSILLITVDALRADRLSPYGYLGADTPAILGLADEGLVFENAVAAPSVLPSLASVMTGTPVTVHGLRRASDRLAEGETMLATRLHDHGYHTAAVVGASIGGGAAALSQGFTAFDGESAGDPPTAAGIRADDEVAARAIAWLDANAAEPFFLWIRFGPRGETGGAAHPPAGADDPQAAATAAYDASVAQLDAAVGRVLEHLRHDGSALRIAILFHGSTGRAPADTGSSDGEGELSEISIRVPLIVRLPGGERAAHRVTTLARSIDIVPTALRIAGLPMPPELPGRDLVAEPTWTAAHAYLEAGASAGRAPPLVAIRTERWKLIARAGGMPCLAAGRRRTLTLHPAAVARRPPRFELYDVIDDPREEVNLACTRPDILVTMYALLARYEERPGAPARGPDAVAPEPPGDREREGPSAGPTR